MVRILLSLRFVEDVVACGGVWLGAWLVGVVRGVVRSVVRGMVNGRG